MTGETIDATPYLRAEDIERLVAAGWTREQIAAMRKDTLQAFMMDETNVPTAPPAASPASAGAAPAREPAALAGGLGSVEPTSLRGWFVPITPMGVNWRAVAVWGAIAFVAWRFWPKRGAAK